MKVFKNLNELEQWTGKELGPTEWKVVTQDMINDFAKATGDHQWIHVDPDQARSNSPFGTTIAHGFLTLSLLPSFMMELYQVETSKMGINYGVNKVRFISAVPSGSRVRMKGTIARSERVERGLKYYTDCYIELENVDRPACFAQTITILYE